MVKSISTPGEFRERIDELVFEAGCSPTERIALAKKIPQIEAIRGYLAKTATPADKEQMDNAVDAVKNICGLRVLNEEHATSCSSLLVKRILPFFGIPLAIYLYKKDKLPNLEGLAKTISSKILPAIFSKAIKSIPPETVDTFKPAAKYWGEGAMEWKGYDSRLLFLAGMGALGLFLACIHQRDPKKEINFTL